MKPFPTVYSEHADQGLVGLVHDWGKKILIYSRITESVTICYLLHY